MHLFNFTLKDILGTCLAFFIFPAVLLFPGYVISWALDLYDFRQRRILTKHVIAILISVAVVPILVYLLAFFSSFYATRLMLAFFFLLYAALIVNDLKKSVKGGAFPIALRPYQKTAFWVAAGWVCFAIVELFDLQWGERLYNNVVSMDFATRVTLINAITRTGVPPVNPSFFPGHPEYITSLYYFWYVLCSITDQFGGSLVDARMALIAGDIWCGLALMALIALYLKIRNHETGDKAWKTALAGIGLLTISGLDFIPALINMLALRLSRGFMWPQGDIEHWNEQITAWVGSLFWVPHHIAGMIACLTVFMLFQYYYEENFYKKIPVAIVAGLACASAVGLSIWVTLTFSIFLGIWALLLLIQNKDKRMIPFMIFTGLVGLLFAMPFLLGVLKGGTGASGSPIVLSIRAFLPIFPYIARLPASAVNLIFLLLLPVNYALELGFFFFIGYLWLQQYQKKPNLSNPFLVPEIILLATVFLVCSFVRSAIVANDLGWRGWLLGQFILLVWAVDLYDILPSLLKYKDINDTHRVPQKNKIKKVLAYLLFLGFLTSVIDAALLRFWAPLIDTGIVGFPNNLSADTQLGQRTFAGRLAYEFIDTELPADIVVQPNPFPLPEVDWQVDRPSGLYGSRQNAVSPNAPFNVPLPLLDATKKQISQIFVIEHTDNWDQIDQLCREYFIDALVVSDLDPLWKNLPILLQQRAALYKNRYYVVFACGHFVLQNDYNLNSIP